MIFNKNAITSLSKKEGVHGPPRSDDAREPEEFPKSNSFTGKKGINVVTSNKNDADGSEKGDFKGTTSSEDIDDSYIFDDEHFSTCPGDVSDDKEKDILEIMLEKSELKKFYMIMANQKYGVPLKSSCVIINNNYVQDGKTVSKDPNPDVKDDFYLTIDEKLDVIIYVVDLIWHELNDSRGNRDLNTKLKYELDESMENLHKMIKKLGEKVDLALDKISAGDRKNDSEN